MSSMSWEEYLTRFVDITRAAYEPQLVREGLVPEYLIELVDLPAIPLTLPEPCQITVFEFSSTPRIVWIVAFEKTKTDMYFKVEKSKESIQEFLKNYSEYEKFEEALSLVGSKREDLQKYYKEDYVSYGGIDYIGFLFFSDPKYNFSPRQLALDMYHENIMWVLRSIQRARIEQSTLEILEKFKKTGDKGVLAEIKSIEKSLEKLKKIDEHERKLMSMEDRLAGVRKLIGTKTFGEWKVLLSEIDKINTRINAFSDIKTAYDKVLAQQNEFMKQQSEVMKQQSSFVKWVKYATILLPIAVICVPIIETLLRHFLGIS